MSFCNETTVVKSRKGRQCLLCFERIPVGSPYVRRVGVNECRGDPPWTMAMHPECYQYEQSAESPVDPDWYECVADRAFDRADALRWYAKNVSPFVVTMPDVPLGKQLYVSRLREGAT